MMQLRPRLHTHSASAALRVRDLLLAGQLRCCCWFDEPLMVTCEPSLLHSGRGGGGRRCTSGYKGFWSSHLSPLQLSFCATGWQATLGQGLQGPRGLSCHVSEKAFPLILSGRVGVEQQNRREEAEIKDSVGRNICNTCRTNKFR
ncbi:hypothetical protein SRHO_G00275810 [Serrasalmus rhombeus]